MERPIGVTIVSIVAGIVGLWNLFVTYSSMYMGGWMSWVSLWTGAPPTDLPPNYATLGPSAFWLALLGMIVAGVTVAAAIGLWLLRPWGWWLAIGGLALGLLTSTLAQLQGFVGINGAPSSLLAVVALAYLLLPHVRRAFVAPPAAATSA
jgi:hypothetical protein